MSGEGPIVPPQPGQVSYGFGRIWHVGWGSGGFPEPCPLLLIINESLAKLVLRLCSGLISRGWKTVQHRRSGCLSLDGPGFRDLQATSLAFVLLFRPAKAGQG